MADFDNSKQIDFSIDRDNLYREDAITDLKVASIRRLVPIQADGSEDASRSPIFMGHSQVMTPEGPLPIQSRLMANTLAEAYDAFPDAMQKSLNDMISQLQEMQRKEQEKKREDSRIIIPGR
jgi:hypothetical protein